MLSIICWHVLSTKTEIVLLCGRQQNLHKLPCHSKQNANSKDAETSAAIRIGYPPVINQHQGNDLRFRGCHRRAEPAARRRAQQSSLTPRRSRGIEARRCSRLRAAWRVRLRAPEEIEVSSEVDSHRRITHLFICLAAPTRH